MSSTVLTPPSQSFLSNATEPLPSSTLKIGTRSSALAMVQTQIFFSLIHAENPSLTISIHPSNNNPADVDKSTALYAFNAKSLWTSELEAHLVEGKLDVIVHSLKDMPTQLERGCLLGGVLGAERERRDCVVMKAGLPVEVKALKDLKEGDVVGTSSVRRGAQLRRLYPHLIIKDVRGNIGTRIRKLDAEGGEFACLILAAAGVQRVGLGHRVSSFLGRQTDGWYAAVGQGALGIEIREEDAKAKGLVAGLMKGREEKRRFWEALAERSCLRTLEGGCSVPIGVDTEWGSQGSKGSAAAAANAEGGLSLSEDEVKVNNTIDGPTPTSQPNDTEILTMHATVISVDGARAVQSSYTQPVCNAEDADMCGWKMAQALIEKGAGEILKEILLNRGIIGDQDGA